MSRFRSGSTTGKGARGGLNAVVLRRQAERLGPAGERLASPFIGDVPYAAKPPGPGAWARAGVPTDGRFQAR
jgi:hypothetical protein